MAFSEEMFGPQLSAILTMLATIQAEESKKFYRHVTDNTPLLGVFTTPTGTSWFEADMLTRHFYAGRVGLNAALAQDLVPGARELFGWRPEGQWRVSMAKVRNMLLSRFVEMSANLYGRQAAPMTGMNPRAGRDGPASRMGAGPYRDYASMAPPEWVQNPYAGWDTAAAPRLETGGYMQPPGASGLPGMLGQHVPSVPQEWRVPPGWRSGPGQPGGELLLPVQHAMMMHQEIQERARGTRPRAERAGQVRPRRSAPQAPGPPEPQAMQEAEPMLDTELMLDTEPMRDTQGQPQESESEPHAGPEPQAETGPQAEPEPEPELQAVPVPAPSLPELQAVPVPPVPRPETQAVPAPPVPRPDTQAVPTPPAPAPSRPEPQWLLHSRLLPTLPASARGHPAEPPEEPEQPGGLAPPGLLEPALMMELARIANPNWNLQPGL